MREMGTAGMAPRVRRGVNGRSRARLGSVRRDHIAHRVVLPNARQGFSGLGKLIGDVVAGYTCG
jgi:hypothetical protein